MFIGIRKPRVHTKHDNMKAQLE